MKTENKIVILFIIMALILVGSIIFINSTKTTEQEEYVYNDFRVFKNPSITGYIVVAYIGQQPYHLQLRYDPKNTENITIDPGVRPLILNKEAAFFTLKPDLTSIPVLGAIEMASVLGKKLGIYNKKVFGAISEEGINSTGNLVVNCDNVTAKANIVMLQIGNETKVYLEKNNCIIVQGTDEFEIVRASDRLIYDVLEVIK